MKAITYYKYGLPDLLRLEEVPKPTPKDNEVLIKVHAASINSWDYDLLTGTFQGRIGAFRKPRFKILGCDVAGTVVALGKKVKELKIGDEVFGDTSGFGERDFGCFADFACAREEILAIKSPKMTFVQAAATPQAAVLALQGLRDLGHIKKGQRVLINGAGGGVGTFAIEIAKSIGTHITAVDSTKKLDKLRSIGADEVIDYTKEDFTKGSRYDLILDVQTTRSTFKYKRALNSNGIYATVGGKTPKIMQIMLLGPVISKMGNRKLAILMHKPRKKDLMYLTELFDAGKIQPVIDSTFPLSNLPKAMEHFGKSDHVGKIVITLN